MDIMHVCVFYTFPIAKKRKEKEKKQAKTLLRIFKFQGPSRTQIDLGFSEC
jgi:hypothetical protein